MERRRLFWILAWLTIGLSLAPAGVREGMTRAEVEAVLGAPLSSLSAGERTVLNYPGEGRVELVSGRVVRAVRVARHDDEPAAAPAPEPVAAPVTEEAPVAPPEELFDGAAFMDETPAEQMLDFWTGLAIAALVQTVVGLVVLKLAFRWEDLSAEWRELIFPAVLAAAAGAVTRGAAWQFWGATELFRVDDALSFAALIFALLKFTNACTWGRAAGVAAAAKVMTILVWSILSVFLTRLLFV